MLYRSKFLGIALVSLLLLSFTSAQENEVPASLEGPMIDIGAVLGLCGNLISCSSATVFSMVNLVMSCCIDGCIGCCINVFQSTTSCFGPVSGYLVLTTRCCGLITAYCSFISDLIYSVCSILIGSIGTLVNCIGIIPGYFDMVISYLKIKPLVSTIGNICEAIPALICPVQYLFCECCSTIPEICRLSTVETIPFFSEQCQARINNISIV